MHQRHFNVERCAVKMTRMAKVAFFVAAFLCASFACASPDSAFKSALARSLDADATWTMVKTFEDSPFKFRFEGMVSCARGKGVVWSMERPLRSRIVMSERGMAFSGDGKGGKQVPTSELPHYQEIKKAIDVFLAGGDISFEKLFDLSYAGTREKWSVSFVPKRLDMRSIIKSVSVSGAEKIENVEFCYASGENAKIEFCEIAKGAHSLWKGRE